MEETIVHVIRFETASQAEHYLSVICKADPSLVSAMNALSGSFDAFAMYPRFSENRLFLMIEIGFSETVIDRVRLADAALPSNQRKFETEPAT